MTSEVNGNSIRVSNREIYDGLRAVENAVLRLSNQVENALRENVDLEARIRKLELKYYAVLAGLITVAGAWLARVVIDTPAP